MGAGKQYIFLALAVLFISLAGCFEKDERITPHTPGDEQSFTFERSIYTNQSYFDLGSNEIISENVNSAWLMRFGSQAADWHIGINSADLWAVYNSLTSELDSVSGTHPTEKWVFDKSSGEPDSTAFAGWVHFPEQDTVYNDDIYLIGKFDGVSYRAKYAVQFLSVDREAYHFRFMDWPDGNWGTDTVPKEPSVNYQYYSPANGGEVVPIEPDRAAWDLEFTQYGSILYTSEGVPTPYYVRGVLLNANGVAAALDTTHAFSDITYDNLSGYTFSTREDFIGYEWKSVKVDVTSGTAVYTVNSNYTYIIRDTEGFYHKMRFISFYNDLGEKGFPVIEHLRL